jgi:hypothetical protein
MHSLSHAELRKLGVMIENFSRRPPGSEAVLALSAGFIPAKLDAFVTETGFGFAGSAIELVRSDWSNRFALSNFVRRFAPASRKISCHQQGNL